MIRRAKALWKSFMDDCRLKHFVDLINTFVSMARDNDIDGLLTRLGGASA